MLNFAHEHNLAMKINIVLDKTPCRSVKLNRRFRETYHLHLHAGFLLGLLCDVEDGDMFLRNVD
jgi:hypothetical protein